MSIGSNIRNLREKHQLTQTDLAKIAGVSNKAVSTWENDIKTPRMGAIQKMADYFRIDKSDIISDYASNQTNKPRGIKIPVLGYVPAGVPIEAIEDIIDYEEIPADWTNGGSEFFGLKVKGDSMEPEIKNGDIVIVRCQPDADSGQTVIVMVNGDEATCKRIQKSPEGVILVPNNPAYQMMYYSNKEVAELPLTVIGKVVELRRSF
jgi:repressor LexA